MADAHFDTLLLIAPYLTEAARTIIKALSGLAPLGYLMIETSGIVPWDNTQASLLLKAFGRRQHDINEYSFKTSVIPQNVTTGLFCATRTMVECSEQGAILKDFLESVPRGYYYGDFQALGLPQDPPADGYGILLPNVSGANVADVTMEATDILGNVVEGEMD